MASGQSIGVRGDSDWSVPEPELGLVLDETGAIVGWTIGNDVSARDIEGANPLYLPQAKIFAASCAPGPVVLIRDPATEPGPFHLTLSIADADCRVVFTGETSTEAMQRSFEDLVSYVVRYNRLADGTVLLTGTGIVPPADVALDDGYIVEVAVNSLGRLRNGVRRLSR